jgi:hypothetical protein
MCHMLNHRVYQILVPNFVIHLSRLLYHLLGPYFTTLYQLAKLRSVK